MSRSDDLDVDRRNWATDLLRYKWAGLRLSAWTAGGGNIRNDNGEISFGDGWILYVDPNLEAKHQNIVVVRLHGDSHDTLGQLLIEENGRKILRAPNPSQPNRELEMPEDARTIGVVVRHFDGQQLMEDTRRFLERSPAIGKKAPKRRKPLLEPASARVFELLGNQGPFRSQELSASWWANVRQRLRKRFGSGRTIGEIGFDNMVQAFAEISVDEATICVRSFDHEPNTVAWHRLEEILETARTDQAIAQSPAVTNLIGVLLVLIHDTFYVAESPYEFLSSLSHALQKSRSKRNRTKRSQVSKADLLTYRDEWMKKYNVSSDRGWKKAAKAKFRISDRVLKDRLAE